MEGTLETVLGQTGGLAEVGQGEGTDTDYFGGVEVAEGAEDVALFGHIYRELQGEGVRILRSWELKGGSGC